MKKWIILILFLMIILSVNATYELCGDTPKVSSPCTMVTPELTTCTTFNYNIFSINGTIIESNNLTILEGNIYYFNLTQAAGEYIIRLCDGAIREITVKNDVEQYYIYVIALLVFITLLSLGFYLKNNLFIIISGMLCCIIAADILLNGFPNLTNAYLKNGIPIILLGIGFYFILSPSLEFLENFGRNEE